MQKFLFMCSEISLIYGNCVWGMDYNGEGLFENPWDDSNLDPLKEKMGKYESAAMDSLAKIRIVFDCIFDDIVEI